MQLHLAELLAQLPPTVWTEADQVELAERLASDRRKLIVLDDDPTGIQTVHDVPVYTAWEPSDLEAMFLEPSRLCFILTNTRAMSADAATAVVQRITERICAISRRMGLPFAIISRGDSTLRGHWPLENAAVRSVIARETNQRLAGEIIVPCFFEGGRYTWNNRHWVASGDRLIPVGETEFARDSTFSYNSSHLCDFVSEKTGGSVRAQDVLTISLETLRSQGAAAVADILSGSNGYRRVVVNALNYRDLTVFTLGLLRAEAKGRQFLVQSAASFVKARAGVSDRPLLNPTELVSPHGKGGLVIVGSHVEKTNRQLQATLQLPSLCPIELNVARVLSEAAGDELRLTQQAIDCCLLADKTAVVYTSRDVLTKTSGSSEANLGLSRQVSLALVDLLRRLEVMPRFLITKGGITSSDLGTHGLGVRRALALGQIRPGIPVWDTGAGSKFPHLPLIIFPGNVGDDETLRDLVAELERC